MIRTVVIILALLSFCSTSFAVEKAELEITTVAESLLEHDWEELVVEMPTRRPTKLKHVAENLTIITVEEIEAMNAHSLAGALQNYTGIFFGHYNHEFAGEASFHIHGSEYHHIVLLVDGVSFTDDTNYPHSVGLPMQIIERIEIVKGPAASSWGSALGDVINIVTGVGGNDIRPADTLYGHYGEGANRLFLYEKLPQHGSIQTLGAFV